MTFPALLFTIILAALALAFLLDGVRAIRSWWVTRQLWAGHDAAYRERH
jgi:hypothetical protein